MTRIVLALLLLAGTAWVGFSYETVYDWSNPVDVGFFQGTPEEWDQFQSVMDAKHSRKGWGFGFSLLDARKEPQIYHVTWRVHGKARKLRFFGQAWAGDWAHSHLAFNCFPNTVIFANQSHTSLSCSPKSPIS